MSRSDSKKNKIDKPSPLIALSILQEIKDRIKNHDAILKVFDRYQIPIEEIDTIPVCFADLDVSAKTDHGIIYLNYALLEDGFPTNDHYLVHEIVHYAQQTTGDGPTEGSTDDTYLDNPYEQEGFQVQTEDISETHGDQSAKQYIDQVLKYHEVPNSEKKEKKKDLLRLAVKQLSLEFSQVKPTQEQLLKEYDAAIARGPQISHQRRINVKPPMTKGQTLEKLRALLQRLEQPMDPMVRQKLERQRQLLQLSLKLDSK